MYEVEVMKKKIDTRLALILAIYEIVFIIITSFMLVFYGPFINIKKTIVESAMTSFKHKYIVQLFLSDKNIHEILSEDKVKSITQNKNDNINLNLEHNSAIDRYDIKSNKFNGYLLVVHDPTRVKIGFTNKLGIRGQLTSQIAKENSAVAAINAGGFVDRSSGGAGTGTGGQPSGVLMSGGMIKFNDTKSNLEKINVVGLTDKGLLIVGKYNINEMKSLKVAEVVNFGPALIVNGEPTIKKGDGGWGIAPRTAIGQRSDGAILLLVIDGRRISSIGASLKDVQSIMLKYGAVNSSNLDGGSSSTLYFNGKVINNPCDSLGERSVPSAFIVKK
jgi:exopolysaccharide biosynthesis protein